MNDNETNLLIYEDTDPPDTPEHETTSENEDEKKEGFQEFIDKIRGYNRQGPHYIYSERSDYDRKIKDTRRLIRKSGKYNVSRHVESDIWEKYLRDFCNTLVHSRWRWTVLAASSSFILSWLIFAVIWMLISNANGDSEIENDRLKCLVGIKTFGGYFMFSLETQTTIGYGGRWLTDHCPEGVFIICLQIIMGVAICGLTINIVYIKMTKSQYKYTKLFSKHAVICRRDGELCLIFRVRDEDSRHAIGTTITAFVLRKDKETGEPYLETIPLEPHGFLIWPLEIVHKITSTSPLWDVSSYNLISDKFEVIVTLQGTSPTTAQCSRTRTSYISSEILWGHKFKNCIKFIKKEKAYVVNQKNFNTTEEYAIHLCSAKRFAEVYTSLSPTPKNYRFKLNIMYNGNQRRGTLVSIETADGSNNRLDDNSESSKETKDKVPNNPEKIMANSQYLEKPSSPISLIGNYHNQYATCLQNTNYRDSYEGQWGYQNYSGNDMPDFWLKEAKSLPLINNYKQDHELKSRKFDSDLQHLKTKGVQGTSSDFNESKGRLSQHRIFEGEEFVYDNCTSAAESNMSLLSVEYPRSDIEIERDAELDAMLKSMESYLERHSTMRSSSSLGFPKM